MRKKLGRVLNKIINPFGYSINPIHKIIPKTSDLNWAEKLGIQTIIDIGSNEGQFIKEINDLLPDREILAFEPIESCYNKLVENTKHLRIKTYKMGLGDKESNEFINISKNFESSSFLEMENLHKTSYPDSRYVKKSIIEINRLDEVLKNTDLKLNVLIKLDVQGYEKNVIMGGEKTFENAAVLIIESVFEPFYKDQWLFDDLHKHFSAIGFKFMGFTNQFNSQKTGIPMYADSIFINKKFIPQIL